MSETTPRPNVATLSKAEYRARKSEALRELAQGASEARDAAVLEQIKNAPDDATRRRLLHQYGQR